MHPRRLVAPLIAVALASLAGCANLRRLSDDLDRLDTLGAISGRVEVRDWDGAPLAIVVLDLPPAPGHPQRVVRYQRLERPGSFAFYLEPGEYRVVAFEDRNRDGDLTDGERGVLLDTSLRIEPGARVDDLDLRVERVLPRRPPEDRPEYVMDRSYVVGEVRRLEDERFGIQLGRMGVWQPATWNERAKPGLYMLQEYEEDTTPVIFVHGMSGYPQEFAPMVGALDRERFQPWVFLYPSGFRASIASTLLRLAVDEAHIEHPFERVCLVAHSVGGIVAREYFNEAAAAGDPLYARGLVSIAAPFGGIPSAAKGVRMAPEVVPAWYDLVPDGPFLTRLFERPLPPEVEFHLLMSYIPEEPSDGVVYISSQLRPEAQGEADEVRGYAETHGGSLRSADVIAQVNVALDRCRGDRLDAPRAAPRTPGGGSTTATAVDPSPLSLPGPGRAP